jgi:transcriptional regulator with XRE-family HTH domain
MKEPTFKTPAGFICADLRAIKDTWPGGISYVEIARRAGMHKASAYRLLNGGGNPTVDTLCRLAEALDRSLSFELLDRPCVAPAHTEEKGEGT